MKRPECQTDDYKAAYIPTAEEIAASAAEVREGWTEVKEFTRRGADIDDRVETEVLKVVRHGKEIYFEGEV